MKEKKEFLIEYLTMSQKWNSSTNICQNGQGTMVLFLVLLGYIIAFKPVLFGSTS